MMSERDLQEAIEFELLNYKIGLIMAWQSARFNWWKFVHNAVVHPLMAWPWDEPGWLNRLHDWTAARCPGRG